MSDTRLRRAVTVRDIERGLVRACLGTAFACALACILGAHLLWNWTASLPLGLYWLSPDARSRVKVGALVALRRYLPPGAMLVKPIVATSADSVCTDDDTLTVNGATLGAIRSEDTRGRPLPRDARCGPLPEGQIFVASHLPTSFDSRTFGPVPLSDIRGTVTPLWTY